MATSRWRGIRVAETTRPSYSQCSRHDEGLTSVDEGCRQRRRQKAEQSAGYALDRRLSSVWLFC